MKMVKHVVGVTCVCRVIGYSNKWLNGREIDAATHVCALRLLSASSRSFVLRFWGKLQALCYATNWERAIQYSFHIISAHLKIGYSACASELYGCNVICLSCLLFSCCNKAKIKNIQHQKKKKKN